MTQLSQRLDAITSTELDTFNQWLPIFKEHRSFELEQVIKLVVQSESKRMKDESNAWRVGFGLVGLMLGMGDGFQAADLFTGLAFSSVGATVHGEFSKEDREQLEKFQMGWVCDEFSPVMLDKRLGRATSRVIGFHEGQPFMYSMRSGSRGQYAIPMSFAGTACPAFTEENSRAVMLNTFNVDGIEQLQRQFYPAGAGSRKVDGVRRIKWDQAYDLDPEISQIAHESDCEPILVDVRGDVSLVFRTEVPIHSDY
jgi:hypothetical protein